MKKENPIPNSKPFKKGDPRINRGGAPKKLPQIDVLLAKVLGEDDKGQSDAEAILEALKAKALAGDTRAAELLLDRAYGKPKQDIQIETKTLPDWLSKNQDDV